MEDGRPKDESLFIVGNLLLNQPLQQTNQLINRLFLLPLSGVLVSRRCASQPRQA
jgi:hypothetical protein